MKTLIGKFNPAEEKRFYFEGTISVACPKCIDQLLHGAQLIITFVLILRT